MEVCSGLSKCLEQILLKIKSNMEPRHPSALPVLPNMSFGRLHVLLIVVVDIVVSELPQTTVVTNERQGPMGWTILYPPFTCLDENMLHRHFRGRTLLLLRCDVLSSVWRALFQSQQQKAITLWLGRLEILYWTSLLWYIVFHLVSCACSVFCHFFLLIESAGNIWGICG